MGKPRMSPDNARGEAVVPHRGITPDRRMAVDHLTGSFGLIAVAARGETPSLSGGWD
jgi:hypothetical protein